MTVEGCLKKSLEQPGFLCWKTFFRFVLVESEETKVMTASRYGLIPLEVSCIGLNSQRRPVKRTFLPELNVTITPWLYSSIYHLDGKTTNNFPLFLGYLKCASQQLKKKGGEGGMGLHFSARH